MMADAETLAQGAVERLVENERLRGDLTDVGFGPIVEWASNALIGAARQAATVPDEAAQARMDEAETATKRIIEEVVDAAQRHTRAEVLTLMRDPTIASDMGARLRLAANGWRLGDDSDANAIRLIKALRGVQP
ncbi:MAG TPA: hypothetical protein VIL85_07475 [Thermomicrobiales bacterium]|jgi:hypothetical protein